MSEKPREKNRRTAEAVTLGMSAALAMVLSYLELLLPPIYPPLPAIKWGLANIAVVFVLVRLGTLRALAVAAVKVTLTALLFGSFVSLAYSAAGAVLSLTVMSLLKKSHRFSAIGISVCGGVSHNVGQILMAIMLLGRGELAYYLPVLVVSGTLSGIAVGICGGLAANRVKI